jgi:hypothetical protein
MGGCGNFVMGGLARLVGMSFSLNKTEQSMAGQVCVLLVD